MSKEESQINDDDNINKKNYQMDENDSPSRPFAKYLHQINDFNSGILEMIHCPSINYQGDDLSSTLEGSGSQEDKSSFFSKVSCNPELSLIPFLMDHHDYHPDEELECDNRCVYNPNIVGPRSCEYCNARCTSQCGQKTCDRPKYFFLKKRGPFQLKNNDIWDPDTDYELNALRTVQSFDPSTAAKNEYKIEELRSIFTKQKSANSVKFKMHRKQRQSITDKTPASNKNSKQKSDWISNISNFSIIKAFYKHPDSESNKKT